MVGLSTAWFLREHDDEVTVLERKHVAAGASWGNAGWLTPGLTVPLPEPAVLRFGIRAMLQPDSPLYVPLRADPQLWGFLIGFARHSTRSRWVAGIRAYAPVSRRAFAAFDRMAAGGVSEPVREAEPLLVGFRSRDGGRRLPGELGIPQGAGPGRRHGGAGGGGGARPGAALSENVGMAVRLYGQRFINPPRYMEALARSVR